MAHDKVRRLAVLLVGLGGVPAAAAFAPPTGDAAAAGVDSHSATCNGISPLTNSCSGVLGPMHCDHPDWRGYCEPVWTIFDPGVGYTGRLVVDFGTLTFRRVDVCEFLAYLPEDYVVPSSDGRAYQCWTSSQTGVLYAGQEIYFSGRSEAMELQLPCPPTWSCNHPDVGPVGSWEVGLRQDDHW